MSNTKVTNSQIVTAIGAVASAAVAGYIIYKRIGKTENSEPTDDSTPTPVPEESVPVIPEPKPVDPVPEPSKPEPTPAPSIPKVEDVEPPKVDIAKVEPPKIDTPKEEPPKVEPPKVEPPKVEPPKVEPPKVEPPKKEEVTPKVENITAADQNGNNSDDLEIISSTKDKDIKKETEIKDAAEEEDEEEVIDTGKFGAVLLGMWYNTDNSKISINVVKCRGLKALDVKGTSDPYVKVWLCKNGKEFKKEKTSIKKGRLSPIYNETLEFDLPNTDISISSLKVSVIDDDFGGNDLIGSILIGDESDEPSEAQHWKDTFEHVGASITSWHTLRYFS